MAYYNFTKDNPITQLMYDPEGYILTFHHSNNAFNRTTFEGNITLKWDPEDEEGKDLTFYNYHVEMEFILMP